MKIEELKACTLKLENKSKTAKTVYVYIPNKDSVPYILGVGESIKVTTQSAGESYMYLSQMTSDLAVTVEAGE